MFLTGLGGPGGLGYVAVNRQTTPVQVHQSTRALLMTFSVLHRSTDLGEAKPADMA